MQPDDDGRQEPPNPHAPLVDADDVNFIFSTFLVNLGQPVKMVPLISKVYCKQLFCGYTMEQVTGRARMKSIVFGFYQMKKQEQKEEQLDKAKAESDKDKEKEQEKDGEKVEEVSVNVKHSFSRAAEEVLADPPPGWLPPPT